MKQDNMEKEFAKKQQQNLEVEHIQHGIYPKYQLKLVHGNL